MLVDFQGALRTHVRASAAAALALLKLPVEICFPKEKRRENLQLQKEGLPPGQINNLRFDNFHLEVLTQLIPKQSAFFTHSCALGLP